MLLSADNHQAAFQSKGKGTLYCVTSGCFLGRSQHQGIFVIGI